LIDEHTPDREGDVYAFIFILKTAISNQKDIRRERGRGNRKLLNLKHIYILSSLNTVYCIGHNQYIYLKGEMGKRKQSKSKNKRKNTYKMDHITELSLPESRERTFMIQFYFKHN
jgi:hypothetical protein